MQYGVGWLAFNIAEVLSNPECLCKLILPVDPLLIEATEVCATDSELHGLGMLYVGVFCGVGVSLEVMSSRFQDSLVK
jgi:hypothetical protein